MKKAPQLALPPGYQDGIVPTSTDDRPRMPSLTGGPMARAVDRFIGAFSPSSELKRITARADTARARFWYDSARTTRSNEAPSPLNNPNNPRNLRDQVLLSRRSRDLVQNSGFFSSIVAKYRDYTLGPNLRYLPRTGSEKVDGQITDWLRYWMTTAEATGRFHMLELLDLELTGSLIDGDFFKLYVLDPDTGLLTVQGIESDCIGNPHHYIPSDDEIRGVVVDNGRPVGYKVYHRSANDQYSFEAELPAQHVTHYYRPGRYSAYRGVSAFANVVDLYENVKVVREFETMAIKWGSAKAGFIQTQSGRGPENPLAYGGGLDRNTHVGGDLSRPLEGIEPGEIVYGQIGESIDMLGVDRPNANVVGFIQSLLDEGALGVELPPAFVYNMAGLTGTPTRLVSEQAKRTFQGRQHHMERRSIRPMFERAIMNGIMLGEIDWDKNWSRGKILYPAHPTVDVGRESTANLNENRQALKSAGKIFGEQGEDAAEEQEAIAQEASNVLRLAQRVAQERGVPLQTALNMIQMMSPNAANPADITAQPGGDQAPPPPPTQTPPIQ